MSIEQGTPLVVALDEPSVTLEQVGGKGASLSKLAGAGLPVPRGFHVTTAAYKRFVAENGLQEQILAIVPTDASDILALEAASSQIGQLFAQGKVPDDIAEAIQTAYMAFGDERLSVAVRSSATAEDLPGMSFAGQQDTYLNIQGVDEVLNAVKRCWASLWTVRALGYRARYQIAPQDVSLAVVVQELIPADAAGVLFTVNPLTGSRNEVMINATWGLGEALVSGQVTPDTLVVERASGKVIKQEIADKAVMTVRVPSGTREEPVPEDKRSAPVLSLEQTRELANLGVQIEALYAQPMDIEWARKDAGLFILQARPITTLTADKVEVEEWNDSLAHNYLWSNGNLGEAVPDVMTPSTWSLIQIFMSEATAPMYAKGIREFQPIGNIGGRFYMNISLTMSIAGVFGMGKEHFKASIEEVFGRIPASIDVPLLPASRWRLLKGVFSVLSWFPKRLRANQKRMRPFLATATERCENLRTRLDSASSIAELVTLWREELEPLFRESSAMLEAAARQDGNALLNLRQKLRKLVGEADANALLSGLNSSTSQLASLGPLLGLAQLERGEIDRETYTLQYGHRSPHEFEISIPRPVEDPNWIEGQLASLREAPVDIETRLARQQEVQANAWMRFRQRYPRKAESIRKRIEKTTAVFRDREQARSEVVRVIRALRTFVLRAGKLTGKGDDLFFLSIDEIISYLNGDEASLAHVATRRATYERYHAMPAYPALICGHFDPFKWAADPQRRSDFYDANQQHQAPASATITGFPGSEGVVEGLARVIMSTDEGDQLRPGEVLVTVVTNVGWTPLFPRASAIVTDVGAPLSHAAIVARELGLPAVVGCGNATMRLHTGDRVRVNGKEGTVEVLATASIA
ncbi:PEP/pyruvate-binding domain-containing protein [Ktedonospora formicarum]|uniref:Phosphoenolpyruvate synthase n=1 Tax=Ktedonospora formicarum TaxID=2778364 RepID=A0A8J3I8R4_9CHLR|nr:PEP/pyruvate-binding domain-containing protein [Ktedonospora formicarum]GHO47868.1 hypothetical protein KSX_60310 [Ktedonospora formicarum]